MTDTPHNPQETEKPISEVSKEKESDKRSFQESVKLRWQNLKTRISERITVTVARWNCFRKWVSKKREELLNTLEQIGFALGWIINLFITLIVTILMIPVRIVWGLIRGILHMPKTSLSEFFLFKPSRRPRFVYGQPAPRKKPVGPTDSNGKFKQDEWDNWIAYLHDENVIGQDFVSTQMIKRIETRTHQPWNKSSQIAQDVDVLSEELIPVYLEVDYQAKLHQNLYYHYQWAFVILSFLTTISATLVVFAKAPGSFATLTDFMYQHFAVVPDWERIFGIITTVTGAIATLYGTLNSRYRPQIKWYRYRRITEELRKYYFLYLAHMPPFDGTNHRELLRPTVGKIKNMKV